MCARRISRVKPPFGGAGTVSYRARPSRLTWLCRSLLAAGRKLRSAFAAITLSSAQLKEGDFARLDRELRKSQLAMLLARIECLPTPAGPMDDSVRRLLLAQAGLLASRVAEDARGNGASLQAGAMND